MFLLDSLVAKSARKMLHLRNVTFYYEFVFCLKNIQIWN